MSRMTDYCDLSCDECSQWVPTSVRTLKEARLVMRSQGWTVRGNEDFCPECSENRKKNQPAQGSAK